MTMFICDLRARLPIPLPVETFQSRLKSGTLAYLGNRDRKNHYSGKRCSAQNIANPHFSVWS